MDSSQVALFRLVSETKLDDLLSSFEYVVGVTGEANRSFALTSNGRILTLNERWRVQSEARLPMAKKSSPEEMCQIQYVGSTGSLLVLFQGTLSLFNIDGDNSLMFSRTDVLRCSLSSSGTQRSWPDHDIAYVNSRNQVVHALIHEGSEKQLWKWKSDSPVTAIAYDGLGICLTNHTGCFVHPISSTTVPSLAFSIDRSIVQADTPPPSICHLTEGQFAVTGAMPGMGLFIDCSGSATRPPLWSGEDAIMIAKTESSLLVITKRKLMIFDNSASSDLRQEIDIPHPPSTMGIVSNTPIIFTRSATAEVFSVREMNWAEKAADLLQSGQTDSALFIVRNNKIKTDEDTVVAQQVYIKAGMEKIKEKDIEEGVQMLIMGRITPFDVQREFAHLFETQPNDDDCLTDAVFVQELISRIVEEPWAEDHLKDWTTLKTIANCRLCEEPIDFLQVLDPSIDYDRQSLKEYLNGRKLFNALLIIECFESGIVHGLSLDWLDPCHHPSIHRKIVLHYVKELPSDACDLLNKWISFIVEDADMKEELLIYLRRNPTVYSRELILSLFEGHHNEIEVLLSYYNSNKADQQIIDRLTHLAIDRLQSDDEDENEKAELRRVLFDIILLDTNDNILSLLNGTNLRVERALASNTKDPESAILAVVELIDQEGALPAIDKVIRHYSSSHINLSTHFLRELKKKCESDPVSSSSLQLPSVIRTVIEASPALTGSIHFLPENFPLDNFSPLIARELESTSNLSVSTRLSRSFNESIAKKSVPVMSKCSVQVTANTRCGVCSRGFDTSTTMHFLPNGQLIHAKCHPHLNLCPVTNQVFRG